MIFIARAQFKCCDVHMELSKCQIYLIPTVENQREKGEDSPLGHFWNLGTFRDPRSESIIMRVNKFGTRIRSVAIGKKIGDPRNGYIIVGQKILGPTKTGLDNGIYLFDEQTRVPWNYWHKNFETLNSKFWTKNFGSWNCKLVVWLWFGTLIIEFRLGL